MDRFYGVTVFQSELTFSVKLVSTVSIKKTREKLLSDFRYRKKIQSNIQNFPGMKETGLYNFTHICTSMQN